MTRACCMVPGCTRRPPRGSRICGTCWRAVPVETRLALHGHDDAGRNPEAWDVPESDADRRAWFQFLRWSWWMTLDLAAVQAWAARKLPAPPRELEALCANIGAEIWDIREGVGFR